MIHVLIVENSRSIIELVKERLETIEDICFETATTLKEVEEKVSQTHFDVVLSNIMLKDAIEAEAVEYLLRKRLAVIVLTGGLSQQVTKALYRQGVKKVIVKEQSQVFDHLKQEVELVLGLKKGCDTDVDEMQK